MNSSNLHENLHSLHTPKKLNCTKKRYADSSRSHPIYARNSRTSYQPTITIQSTHNPTTDSDQNPTQSNHYKKIGGRKKAMYMAAPGIEQSKDLYRSEKKTTWASSGNRGRFGVRSGHIRRRWPRLRWTRRGKGVSLGRESSNMLIYN